MLRTPIGRTLLFDGRLPMPLGLPGLQAWFDASKITGLADTDPVATWNDSSGKGNHITQGTGVNQPAYRTGILNGLPVVRYDGTNDTLGRATSTMVSSQILVAAVVRRGATGAFQTIAKTGVSGVGSGGFGIRFANTGAIQMMVEGVAQIAIGATLITSTVAYHVIVATFDGTIGNIYIDGVPDGTGSRASSFVGVGMVVGDNGATEWMNGDIAEEVIGRQIPTDAQRSALTVYLGNKYALPVTA